MGLIYERGIYPNAKNIQSNIAFSFQTLTDPVGAVRFTKIQTWQRTDGCRFLQAPDLFSTTLKTSSRLSNPVRP
jgi:hypothetical protein